MPDITKTDPKTGKSVTFGWSGQGEPPPDILEQVFASVGLRKPTGIESAAQRAQSIGPISPSQNPSRNPVDRFALATPKEKGNMVAGPMGSAMEMAGPPLAAAGATMAGFPEAAPAAATATAGLTGWLSGKLHGDESPSDRAIFDASTEGLGRGMANLAPRAGIRAGLMGHPEGLDPAKASKAFLAERESAGFGGGIAVGDKKKAALRIKDVGSLNEAAEKASPIQFDRRWVEGSSKNVKPGPLTPASDVQAAKSIERKALEQGAEHQEKPDVRLKRQEANATNAHQHEFFRPAPKEAIDIPENNQMSGREFGNFGRNLKAVGRKTRNAELAAKARTGPFVPESESIKGATANEMGRQASDIGSSLIPETKPINDRLSKLYTLEEATNSLPNPFNGYALARRAGIGGAAGAAVAHETGEDPFWGGVAGGVTGLSLTPNNLSRIGYGAGRLGEFGPTLARAASTSMDPYAKKKVQLKK